MSRMNELLQAELNRLSEARAQRVEKLKNYPEGGGQKNVMREMILEGIRNIDKDIQEIRAAMYPELARLEGENRMIMLAEAIAESGRIEAFDDLANDVSGMIRVRLYTQYGIPGCGETELDKKMEDARENAVKEHEAWVKRQIASERHGGVKENVSLKPISFSIARPEDLERIQAFQELHRECVLLNGGFIGGSLEYTVHATGMGPVYSVHCPFCGDTIDLFSDFDG